MAYPCTSRHISERVNGKFAVVQVTHTIDRHGDRQDDTDDLSIHDSQGAAWAACARSDVFA
jgi:hypothetical protein